MGAVYVVISLLISYFKALSDYASQPFVDFNCATLMIICLVVRYKGHLCNTLYVLFLVECIYLNLILALVVRLIDDIYHLHENNTYIFLTHVAYFWNRFGI